MRVTRKISQGTTRHMRLFVNLDVSGTVVYELSKLRVRAHI